MNFWQKIPAFLWPSGKSFSETKDDRPKDVLIYLLACSAFFAFANIAISTPELVDAPFMTLASSFIFATFLNITFVAILSPVNYLMAKLLGGQGGLKEMFLVVTYSFTPTFVLGWLPGVGVLAAAISFGNVLVGTKKIFRLSLFRSASL